MKFTKEHRRKISEALKGKRKSSKHVENMRRANLGKKLSAETKAKISLAVKGEKHPLWGTHHSKETREKISFSNLNHPSWSKGKKLHYTVWNKGKRFPQVTGENHFLWGKKQSESVRYKISQSKIGKQRGENNPNWKGGKTELGLAIRSSLLYQQWQKNCLRRDNFSCVECGDKRGGNLEVDHIVPFSFLIKAHVVTTIREAEVCDDLWDIANGRTLCQKCHIKTPTFGTKARKYLPQH